MTKTDAEATENRRSILNELKADAGAISLESVLTEIAKLRRLRGLGLPGASESWNASASEQQPRPPTNCGRTPALRATLISALCWLRQVK